MEKDILICFTGIDGSGKTSHALALQKKIRNDGITCKYAWCRWSLGPSSAFHFIIRKTLGYYKEKYVFCKPLQTVFRWLLFLEFTLTMLLKIRIPANLGHYVIIDRYIYDILADLSFWRFDTTLESFFVRLFIAMNQKPDITFLIDVPSEIAFLRKKELSPTILESYREKYNAMAKKFGFQRITNIIFSEAHEQILKKIRITSLN